MWSAVVNGSLKGSHHLINISVSFHLIEWSESVR